MGDLLHEMADALDVTIRGNLYQRTMQLMAAIREKPDNRILIDEAPQMKKWDVDKFEQLRQILGRDAGADRAGGHPQIGRNPPPLERQRRDHPVRQPDVPL